MVASRDLIQDFTMRTAQGSAFVVALDGNQI